MTASVRSRLVFFPTLLFPFPLGKGLGVRVLIALPLLAMVSCSTTPPPAPPPPQPIVYAVPPDPPPPDEWNLFPDPTTGQVDVYHQGNYVGSVTGNEPADQDPPIPHPVPSPP
jgi:hypothetical protein